LFFILIFLNSRYCVSI